MGDRRGAKMNYYMVDKELVMKAKQLGLIPLSYSNQWTILDRARVLGWKGKTPSILGTYNAKKSLADAIEYLLAVKQKMVQ